VAGQFRSGGVPTAQAAHGAYNFTSSDTDATVHAENTAAEGAALLGTTSNPTAPTVPGVGVRGQATSSGQGWGVLAERLGSGPGIGLVVINLSTASGDAASIERSNIGSNTAAGRALDVLRNGKGAGDAIRALAIAGAGHGLLGVRGGLAGGDGVQGIFASAEGRSQRRGAGVHGIAPGEFPAVLAESGIGDNNLGNLTGSPDNGTALRVRGKALFSTAGSATIPAGSDHVDVAVGSGLVTANSHISVTLASDPGTDIYVVWVQRNPGASFTVHLNKNVPTRTRLTYFVVEPTE
jgi:hypothetical protein